jgi:hypothetical protein
MKKSAIASMIIALTGLSLFTTLLSLKIIGEPTYIALLGLVTVVCFGILALKRIREFDIKNFKMTLDKMEEIQTNIFAKEEDLKQISSALFDISIALGSTVKIHQELIHKALSKTEDKGTVSMLRDWIEHQDSELDKVLLKINATNPDYSVRVSALYRLAQDYGDTQSLDLLKELTRKEPKIKSENGA